MNDAGIAGRPGAVRVEGRARRGGWLPWAALAVVITAPLLGYVVIKQREAGAAADAYWSLAGTPCPALSQAAFEARPRKPMTFAFDGVSLVRGAGHLECTHRTYLQAGGAREAPVCDFTGPIALAVSVGGKQAFFAPPGSARVAVIDGAPVCVQRPPTKVGN